MDTKHTPGPWFVSENAVKPALRPYAIYSRHDCICDVLSEIEEGPTDRDTANARLIAAAPELLEALEELADLMDLVRSGEYKPDSFSTQPARAAIKKAVSG